MTDSRSPRLKPSAASPSAKSRTWPRYSLHIHACQMPRSFSRMAARRGNSRAFLNKSPGSVVRAFQSAMLLQAVRQRARGTLAQVLDLQEIDEVLDALSVFDLFPLGEAPVHEGGEDA